MAKDTADTIAKRGVQAIEFIQSRWLTPSEWEWYGPEGDKTRFGTFRDKMAKMISEGYHRNVAEILIKALKDLDGQFEVVRERLRYAVADLIESNELLSRERQERKRSSEDDEENYDKEKTKLDELREKISDEERRLYDLEDLSNFSAEMIEEFLSFWENLARKEKFNPQEASGLLLKEFQKKREVIKAKYDSKSKKEETLPQESLIPTEPGEPQPRGRRTRVPDLMAPQRRPE